MQGNVNPMLNKEIDLVYEWLVINKLVLTISKSRHTIFYPYREDITSLKLTLSINVVASEKVE